MLSLAQSIRLSKNHTVAFVGAGGKTSAMFRVARELTPAIVTTSTHLGSWQVGLADTHFVWGEEDSLPDMEAQLGHGITLVTGTLDVPSQRYRGPNQTQLEKLKQLAGFHDLPLLIEADGSHQKNLKAPGAGEPVIPGFVDLVVVVVGLNGLDQPLQPDLVHRPLIFSELSGLEMGEIITPQALARVLAHPLGGLKNIPEHARKLVLLNQADTPRLQSMANQLVMPLLSFFDAVIVAALEPAPGSILAVNENVAAVILAAGASSRYGGPKQLLDFHGRTFARAVSETALRAGLSPVVFVTGSNATAVSAAVEDLPLEIIHNPDWKTGQSTSIIAGVNHLPKNIGGAIFLLVDQPQVTVELLRALVERHAYDLPAVLAPYIFDQRANPLLFDRVTFDDLLTITGDTGGRAIFSKHSPRYLNWYDRRQLLDVDTPEDYRRLLDSVSDY